MRHSFNILYFFEAVRILYNVLKAVKLRLMDYAFVCFPGEEPGEKEEGEEGEEEPEDAPEDVSELVQRAKGRPQEPEEEEEEDEDPRVA